MADTYGETGVTYGLAGGTYGGWNVSAAAASGGGRRHWGQSASQPRRIQRFVKFRWQFTTVVTGAVSARTRAHLPGPHASSMVTAPAVTRRIAPSVTVQLAGSAPIQTPTMRTWFDPDADDIALLLLLDIL